MQNIETHPLSPFLPSNSRLLMMGSFPPPINKWTMNFYYPNFQNDMWRIFGMIFFNDKEHFLVGNQKQFDVEKLQSFLSQKGIAIADTAKKVIRLKNNASDNFLEVVEPLNIVETLLKIPSCKAIVTTGQKASDTLRLTLGIEIPRIGTSSNFIHDKNTMKFYRMPSSSRAYPKSLTEKAIIYKRMFQELDML